MHAKENTNNSVGIYKPLIGERGRNSGVCLSKGIRDAGKGEKNRKNEARHGLTGFCIIEEVKTDGSKSRRGERKKKYLQ
jgi:hypothetical protein